MAFTMSAATYHRLACMQETEARAAGLWPDGCPSWDEAFLETEHGWREVWDVAREPAEDGALSFDVGPGGRTVAVRGDARVRVR